ncbi:TetR/AcrR family transcriptional regulator [Planctomonas sp. JC2975]|uniref:TetR/AcrR family transcriptional regulator n=1 Tax=Planctomonas sp. JC2975 TaxID=2729626 RepID=UPI00147335C8|nr:TetR/AcrR family transcriptional regulator [Planctomonas sp. JC2975]NNC11294.1 TetR/AcrR family transcriptional regulator [Planctomonas sp. JC2975]
MPRLKIRGERPVYKEVVIGTAKPVDERPLRADAKRNRERVLQAAKEAFAAYGADVPLDTIAASAGVGAGTVHRHFSTKEALITAVVADRLDGLADRAERCAASDDPGETFYAFVADLTLEAAHNLVLTSALGGAALGDDGARAGARLSTALGELLERGKASGEVRADLTVADLHALLAGVIEAQRRLPSDRAGFALEIAVDGLRPRP